MPRNEKQKEARRRYEMSDKGKAARKRHEATYVASGKRAVIEAKRAEKAEAGAKSVFEMMAKYGRVGAHFIPHDAKEIPVAQRRTWEEFKAAGRPIGLFK